MILLNFPDFNLQIHFFLSKYLALLTQYLSFLLQLHYFTSKLSIFPNLTFNLLLQCIYFFPLPAYNLLKLLIIRPFFMSTPHYLPQQSFETSTITFIRTCVFLYFLKIPKKSIQQLLFFLKMIKCYLRFGLLH